jgi:hypothetical protein
MQIKVQYSFTDDAEGDSGEHLVGGQFTLRF